jgi:hypothetical protein
MIVAILLSAVFITCVLLAFTAKDKQNFKKNMAEHHCQVVGRRFQRITKDTIYRCYGGEIIVITEPSW